MNQTKLLHLLVGGFFNIARCVVKKEIGKGLFSLIATAFIENQVTFVVLGNIR
jgi:hypothetical protein